MSRRKASEESSLELLLDTMCNTFGGVMFIAISLLVIISVMTQDMPQQDEEPADMATLQQEIESLQKIYADLLKELQLKAEQIKLRKSDKTQEKYQELLMLMQLVKEIKLKIEATTLADKTLTAAILKTDKLLAELKKETAKQELELEKLQQELLNAREKLAKLTENERNAVQLSFRVMERSDRAPFFIMMNKELAYPIGPWKSDGKKDNIDKAVIVSSYQYQNSQVMSCKINPGMGIPVLDGEDFSSQFQSLLAKIPPGRVPKFFIPPGSAATAYKMREIMKQRNIYHGTVLSPDDDTPFMFKFTQKAEYEY
ncbi:MAG: hypothetical protein E7039_08365 [Lentisphaerae bacterium]|nr:hypothetical protein [Lentisphaerota bacterium]